MSKPLVQLSLRELEVLRWLKLGKTSWDISQILRISERTVNYHVGNIMQKLDVINRLQAVSAAVNIEFPEGTACSGCPGERPLKIKKQPSGSINE